MIDRTFANLLKDILDNGVEINTRNSIVKRKINLSATFDSTPLISIRRTAWKNSLREWEWFMSGSNNINDLHPKVRHWWEPWANESGFIHNNYSKQFRSFDGAGFGPIKVHNSVDQIEYLIDSLKNQPNSRRAVITTWHTHDMMSPETLTTTCHGSLIQAFVDPLTDEISLTMYQRSADMVLGLPHNFIQYWAFLHYLAHQSGRKVGKFHWIGGDCHIYQDHIEMAEKIVNHKDIDKKETPVLYYNPTSENFKADDFTLDREYNPIIRQSLSMSV